MKNPDFKHISEIFESKDAKRCPRWQIDEVTLKSGHLNIIMNSLETGQIIVLGGRPGMGKISTAIQLAVRLAIGYGKTVGYVTLELSSAQITNRLVSFYAKNPTQSSALKILMDSPIYLQEKGLAISELEASISRLIELQKIELLIIDYFQLLPTTPQQDSALILAKLKKIAEERRLSILILSQLSRTVDPNHPTRADLFRINDPDNIIDKVFFLLRRSYYDRNSRDHITEILTGK